MKIGILTFWQTEDNYGQLLQCFATQTYLQSLGHETFLVRTTNGHNYNPSFKEQCMDKLRTAYRLYRYPWYFTKNALSSTAYLLTHGKFRKHNIDIGFENFRQQYLHCTKVYTLGELHNNPPIADAFVVGSDQIWNTTDGIYFLSWAKDSVKKLAYAASFGSRHSSTDFCELISPWLKRFDAVSVREESGITLCKEAGRCDVECVVDPTMLLDAQDYRKIASKRTRKEKYMFIYFLGTRTVIDWKQIHQFAKRKHLKIVYVASQGQVDKYEHTHASIHEWLSLIDNAEYVLTNSFHGTVFSLLFGKKFLTYPVSGVATKMNDRITTLLNPLSIDNHIYNGDIKVLDIPIDYDMVHKLMADHSFKGKEFLNKNIWLYEQS